MSVCKLAYYGIVCDRPCCVAALDRPVPAFDPPGPAVPTEDAPVFLAEWASLPGHYACKQRYHDMPRHGERLCGNATGLGKVCVLREGHASSHCSHSGTEWPNDADPTPSWERRAPTPAEPARGEQ